MIKAGAEHKTLVVDILTKAFKDNQSVNYIIQQDKNRQKRISALMDYSFEMCRRFGEVWLSDDHEACALTLFPHEKKFSVASVWLDIKLIFQAIGIGGVIKAMKRETKIRAVQPSVPGSYLWFIGVNPDAQHKGFGSQLLRETIDRANALKLPVYLETSTVTNIPWYQYSGFEIYDELDFGYTLYFLKKEAGLM